jgi:hypothetical protein
MDFDRVEIISKSLVQHGPNNDRIYLMKVHPEEKVDRLIDQLHNLALLKGYTKIFVNVPENIHHLFLNHDFKLEATVSNLHGGLMGCFLGKYLDERRGFLKENEKRLIEVVKASADCVPFAVMRKLIRDAFERGGINTISSHMHNAYTEKNYSDVTPSVSHILPGGSHHNNYIEKLDLIADFIEDLKSEDGVPIPIIFRPFHEHNGD